MNLIIFFNQFIRDNKIFQCLYDILKYEYITNIIIIFLIQI